MRALPWVDPACAGAAPQVADLLTNSDEGLRVSAAEALGSMGPAAASVAPQVADLLKSSDPDVRRSAAEALEKLSTQPDPTLALRLIDASKSYHDLRGVLSFWAYLTGGAQEPNRSRVKGRGAP
jgi:HEAT repeat protein